MQFPIWSLHPDRHSHLLDLFLPFEWFYMILMTSTKDSLGYNFPIKYFRTSERLLWLSLINITVKNGQNTNTMDSDSPNLI